MWICVKSIMCLEKDVRQSFLAFMKILSKHAYWCRLVLKSLNWLVFQWQIQCSTLRMCACKWREDDDDNDDSTLLIFCLLEFWSKVTASDFFAEPVLNFVMFNDSILSVPEVNFDTKPWRTGLHSSFTTSDIALKPRHPGSAMLL
jgi:hypothetical protein